MTALHQNGVFGVSHIDIPVTSLERSARLYVAALGFAQKHSAEGYIDLDASGVTLRLIETAALDRRATLRVQVAQVQPVYAALLDAGAVSLYEPMKTPTHEEIASVHDIDKNTIIAWRALTEDELGFVPELEVEAEWEPDAETLLKSLLLSVPALFRGLARRKIVRLAEETCAGARITQRIVVTAFVLASAKVTRYRLREPLLRHGFELDAIEAELERK